MAFESPRRLPGSLRVLAEVLPDRRAAVCRELTKRFEDVVRGSLEELAARFVEAPRGEITLVLGPTTTSASARVDDDARAAVSRSRRRGRVATGCGGSGGSPDRHVPKRPVSGLSVTRQSTRVAVSLNARYRRSMFTHRATRWVVCASLSVVWALGAAAPAWAWVWPADGEVLRGLRGRWRQVRRGSASRNRHRGRRRACDTGARVRRGVVRRAGPDARPHGDDRHRRRIQGVAHAPRNAARPEGSDRRGGRPDRRSRANGRR